MIKTLLTGTALAASLAASIAVAGPGHGDEDGIGEPGDAAQIDRTIIVEMDEMSFSPETIEVAPGETIRFEVVNVGRAVHEFNIGTGETWNGHRGEMRTMMREGMMSARSINHDRMMEAGMMHDDANSVLLEPGDTGQVIWTFPEGGEIGFACNVPGHREAGMVGDFRMGHDS
ncbi:copper-binding protein [Rhodosalinus sediminis]|uniref:Copper-binding protein n=1 Tax=Rhodosalinus sediminis TaxID=1940533 RepID=A0A3D9BM94_9RHOB|nr:plastocyanin/azurin family copper-binding protein [Rhodosalinus sediminis]REC54634.1 copper-binding protein [Rhodosalinus sediminis]